MYIYIYTCVCIYICICLYIYIGVCMIVHVESCIMLIMLYKFCIYCMLYDIFSWTGAPVFNFPSPPHQAPWRPSSWSVGIRSDIPWKHGWRVTHVEKTWTSVYIYIYIHNSISMLSVYIYIYIPFSMLYNVIYIIQLPWVISISKVFPRMIESTYLGIPWVKHADFLILWWLSNHTMIIFHW